MRDLHMELIERRIRGRAVIARAVAERIVQPWMVGLRMGLMTSTAMPAALAAERAARMAA